MKKKIITKLILITIIIIPLIMISNESMLIYEDLAEYLCVELANASTINHTTQDVNNYADLYVAPGKLPRSRWIPLPVLMIIQTIEFYFDESATLSFDPPELVLPITLWAISEDTIWSLVLVMPSWLVGTEDDGVNWTVTTDSGMLGSWIEITMLPFILDK